MYCTINYTQRRSHLSNHPNRARHRFRAIASAANGFPLAYFGAVASLVFAPSRFFDTPARTVDAARTAYDSFFFALPLFFFFPLCNARSNALVVVVVVVSVSVVSVVSARASAPFASPHSARSRARSFARRLHRFIHRIPCACGAFAFIPSFVLAFAVAVARRRSRRVRPETPLEVPREPSRAEPPSALRARHRHRRPPFVASARLARVLAPSRRRLARRLARRLHDLLRARVVAHDARRGVERVANDRPLSFVPRDELGDGSLASSRRRRAGHRRAVRSMIHSRVRARRRDSATRAMARSMARSIARAPTPRAARRRVRARASKSSKGGRFPPTAIVDARHDEFARARDRERMNDVERACDDGVEAIWALSSREGAAACERLWARDDAGGTTTKRETTTTTTPRIVLTHKNENLYNAYACEMAAVTRPAARAMEVGMFAAANGGDGTTRACAGTRAEIMPLACAASAEELLETVEGMRVRVETRAVAFYHDCVARNARRMSSDEVSRRFRGVVARWSARGLDDSRDERSNAMRFAVVEGLGGYVFGLVTYAPSPSSLSARAVDWARKPRHFSAGTRAEIALACVNVASAHDPRAFDARSGDSVIVDPCCGSGTMLHAAWTRGFAAAGGDVSPGAVVMAKQNLSHFVARAPESSAMPNVIERDALVPGAFDDAYGCKGKRVRALVANLPFGRRVALGGGDGDGRSAPGASASEYAPALEKFRDVAERHVFISGVPIAHEMRALGYENVTEVSLCRFGKSFMTTALGSTATAPLEPSVAFTVEDALANAAGKSEKQWEKKSKKKSNVELSERFSNPDALRVAVDVSYEQDSTRARRSVAKQLCECVGIAHREDALAMTYCDFSGPIAEESREFFFSDRWSSVKMDPRSVEEAFDARDVVYMSPDASEVLDEVDASKVYVVGGIVDLATRGMRTSLTRANASSFRCARLPIREHRPEQTHTVLNIDAVVKILCGRHRGESWDDVFDRELPKRQAAERPKRERRERLA